MERIKKIFRNLFNKNEEDDVKVKEKWSLKKKLLLGGGVLGGIILGIFAYGKNTEYENDEDEEFEDGYEDYTDTDETDLEDTDSIVKDVEVETQE